MNNNLDISSFVNVLTTQAVSKELIKRFKLRRKELKLTQKSLSIKSGVSYASIRRFESIGEISLSSLLKLADAMNYLSDFNSLFSSPISINLKDY